MGMWHGYVIWSCCMAMLQIHIVLAIVDATCQMWTPRRRNEASQTFCRNGTLRSMEWDTEGIKDIRSTYIFNNSKHAELA